MKIAPAQLTDLTDLPVVRRPAWTPSGARDDAVAVEEPLEIRIEGETVAVTLRTPGDDIHLALGFLLAEGIIDSIDDVGSVTRPAAPGHRPSIHPALALLGPSNVIDAVPAPGRRFRWEGRSKRGTLSTSACGVCGRKTIEDLVRRCGKIPPDADRIAPAVVTGAIASLRDHQAVFAETGGTHAAIACTRAGIALASAEDVGRHNAVDKVVGALLRRGLVRAQAASWPSGPPGGPAAAAAALQPVRAGGEIPVILAVSGRCGFEIVQKAARAGIPVVASVSAPTSLAVNLAEETGIALAAFVRGDRMTVFAHPERLAGPEDLHVPQV